MIAEYILGKILVFIFILYYAYEDIKTKSIDIRICIFSYILGILGYIYFRFINYPVDFYSILLGLLPGIGIVILAKLTNQAIGEGDGYFFIGIGLFCGMEITMIIIVYTFLILTIFSLIYILKLSLSGRSVKGKSIALIPFVIPAGIYVLMCS